MNRATTYWKVVTTRLYIILSTIRGRRSTILAAGERREAAHVKHKRESGWIVLIYDTLAFPCNEGGFRLWMAQSTKVPKQIPSCWAILLRPGRPTNDMPRAKDL